MAYKKKPAISLFSGAGGLDIGVDRAGFSTVCAIDSDFHCTNTLKRNARRKTVWNVDVRTVDPVRMRNVLGLRKGDLRLLHGGPPCQPFSQIGKQRGMSDSRGPLIFEMVRFAEAFRPTAVMIEQVPYFARATMPDGQPAVEALTAQFRKLGYEMYVATLDAREYGLPQRRRRVILVFAPRGQYFSFPLHARVRRTVGEAFRDLPAPVRQGEVPNLANHIDVTPARDKERISYVPEGLWLSKSPNVPPDIIPAYS